MSETNTSAPPNPDIAQDPSHMLPEHVITSAFYAPFVGKPWFEEASRLGIDPVIGAAAVSPRRLSRQSNSAINRILGWELATKIAEIRGKPVEKDPYREAVHETMYALRSDAQELLDEHVGKGARVGALVGAATVAYGFNKLLLDGVDDVHRQFGNDLMSSDSSIFPGDWGRVDVFGYKLGIPGFRDVPSTHKEIITEIVETEEVNKSTVEVSASVGAGENDPALDLELTGKEYLQDAEAVQRLIDEIVSVGKNHKITSVEITGIASDEVFANGTDGLGIPNIENFSLAEQRTAVGAVAFEDVAQKNELEVPEFKLASYEDILSVDEVAQLDSIAASLGMDRGDLVINFNRDPLSFSEDISKTLKELLPRGVSYSVSYETTTTNSEVVERVIEVKTDNITAGLPMEALALPTMASGAAVGALLLMSRISKMLTKHSARKEIRKARKADSINR